VSRQPPNHAQRAGLASLLALTVLIGPGCRSKDPPFDPIRARIRAELAGGRIPSIAIAVARGDRVVWEEAFGWADREKRTAATPNTIYALASASKPITTTAVMILREQRLLDLDRPINDYLGPLGIRARIGDASMATVRRVAQHFAGLPGYYETFYPDESDRAPAIGDLIRKYGVIMAPPAERFRYSNLGYAALGSVITHASGKEYAAFLRDAIFAPLGMTHSDLGETPDLHAHRAVRYFLDGSRLPDYTTGCPPAADVCSSVHDLIRFAMLHLKTFPLPGRPLLSDGAIDEMQRSSVPMGTNRYGLGWVITTDARGRTRVGHGGAGAGIDAQLTLVPSEKLAVAVLLNTHVDRHVAGEIADFALNTLLGDPVTTAAASRTGEAPEKRFEPPAELVGTWSGVVSTHAREVPVTLSFSPSGTVKARLDRGPATAVEQPKLEGDRFSGRMEGDLGTSDARRRPYHLEWEVTLRDGILNGALNAIGRHPSRGVGLAYWVELKRERE
jgi:CubicO group peptidase (beta-lactamase class C family)